MAAMLKLYATFISLVVIIEATGNDPNETPHRQSRVTGRIVKLYSGSRPEPILCSSEGFKEDPNNCAVFYRCVSSGRDRYIVYKFQCGPGTVYDPDTEVCNHPRSTRRTECGGYPRVEETTHINEIESGYHEIPSPIASNKPLYIVTTSTTKVSPVMTTKLLTSADSTYPTNLMTTTPYNPNPWVTSSSHVSRPYTTTPRDIFTASTTVNIPHTNSKDNICTSEGFMGDSENCRKFYRCVGNLRGGYTRYEFSCTESTVWDDESQVCNHAWAVKRSRCNQRNDKATTSNFISTNEIVPTQESKNNSLRENGTIQQQLQISHGSQVTQSQTQISNGSAKQNQTQIHYGDRIKPTKDTISNQNQTQISFGSAVSQTQTQIDHGNQTVQTQLQIDHSKDASQSQTQISGPSTTTTSTRQPASGEMLNNDCTEEGFIAHENDCHKFYRCVSNGQNGYLKYQFSCAEGTAWDQSIKGCNHKSSVKTCKSQTPLESTTHPLTTSSYKPTQSYHTTIPTENYQTSPEPHDTIDNVDNGYGNLNPEVASTPSTTSPTTSLTTSSTTWSTTTTATSINNLNGEECTSSGFMGDTNDCKIFYRCVENEKGGYTKHKFNCGEGTVWDIKIEACNHAWAVEKCGGSASSTVTSGPIQTQPANTITILSTTQSASIQDTNNNIDSGYGSSNNDISTVKTPMTTMREPQTQEDFVCRTSGFIGDKRDCKKFYRCVDDGTGGFMHYEFTCSAGTLWDETTSSCNHASSVVTCNNQPPATTIQPIVETETQHTTPHHPPPMNDDNNTGYPSNVETDPIQPTTENSKIPSENNNCVGPGFMADKHNCKKFYRCDDNGKGGFDRTEFSCGKDTAWDQSLKACNYAWAVKECADNSNSEMETSTSSIGLGSTLPVDQTHINQDVSNVNCSDNGTSIECYSEGFIGHPNNCKVFYRCVDDGKGSFTKYEFSCGEGTYWNNYLTACDHMTSDNECSKTGTTTKGPQLIHEETYSETTTISRDDTLIHNPTTTSGVCQSDGFFSDQNDCRKFYRCVDNGKGGYTKYDFICGDKTVWDQELQTCSHEPDGKCKQNTVSETNTLSTTQKNMVSTTTTETTTLSDEIISAPPPTPNDACLSPGYYENEKDCTKFYRCVDNGKGSYTKYDLTCSDGLAWDSNSQSCIRKSKVKTCQQDAVLHDDNTQTTLSSPSQQTTTSTSTTQKAIQSSEKADNCEMEGFFGNSKNCKKFYRCVDNGQGDFTKYDFTCAEGTIWDQDVLTCNHPRDVVNRSCHESQESTESSSSSSSTSTSTESPDDYNNTEMSESSEINCTEAGYYPHPKDCKKFYRCVDWDGSGTKFSVFHFECGEGTIWDPSLTTCNHEQSVHPPRACSGTQSQSSTEPLTSDSTEQSTSTESLTEKPTTNVDESSTEESEKGTTEQFGDTTTQKTGETTTQQSEQGTTSISSIDTTTGSTIQSESTTDKSGESTTPQSSEENTATTTDNTTENATTEESTKSTTEKLTETTTETLAESTTEKSQETTTEKSQETTTDKSPETTTETLAESTTEKLQETTTEKSQETTTDKSPETTTAIMEESTLENSQETTTNNSTEESSTEQAQETTTEESAETTTVKFDESTTGSTEETTMASTEVSTTDIQEESTTASSTATEQSTTETTTTESLETTTSASTNENCPETDEDQNVFVCPTSFRRHPKYCNLFYQCDENENTHEVKIATFTCPNNTIYDENQTKCVTESKATKPCDGEIAQSRRVKRGDKIENSEPITVSTDKHACSNVGYYVFEKDGECSPAFLKCKLSKTNKLQGFVYQCPTGFIFWNVSKRCEPLKKVGFCKRSYLNDWSRRWEIPIESKNVDWS